MTKEEKIEWLWKNAGSGNTPPPQEQSNPVLFDEILIPEFPLSKIATFTDVKYGNMREKWTYDLEFSRDFKFESGKRYRILITEV